MIYIDILNKSSYTIYSGQKLLRINDAEREREADVIT